MPIGIIGVVIYLVYIAYGWGNYGYMYTLDYISKVKISLKCKKQNSDIMKYYQVTESPFNDDPHELKYFSLKKKKIVPIAPFFKHTDNYNAYEFRYKNTSYEINRKTLKLKIRDVKTKNSKIPENVFRLMRMNLKK